MKFTTTIPYLLGTFSFVSNIGNVEGNMKLLARERMRNDKEERERRLAGGSDSGLVFSRGYICIIRQQDFAFAIPEQLDGVPVETLFDLNLLGSSIFQSGGIYDPADVQITDRTAGTSSADRPGFVGDTRLQFAGQRQPKFIPQADPGFFLNGECVATTVAPGTTTIMGHSCLLNLCLGGGGYNCLAIYAGSKFVFNPIPRPVSGFIGFIAENANQFVPSLPPSYPGTIIGGTGLFNGAVGYVDVTTITGSTLAPTFVFSEDDSTLFQNPQAGYITQKINVVSNIPLPVAP